MSLYIKKGSNNIYFSDLIILIDKNGAPYCIFKTIDSFDVGDILILYINDTEYVRFKIYRIKEFKEMNEPVYYQIIALHLSDWEWKSLFNPDEFEIGVQKDWGDGTRTIKLYVTSLDAMNLSLLKEISETPTTIPTNAPVLQSNVKCNGNTDALTSLMGETEPYTILIKDNNNIQIIYDSQITNEIDVSDWIPFESYEKWTDPSGTNYQSQIKYYIKEGHFTSFYYAGEKYNDGSNTGTINTMILYPNKTEIYDTFNPSISRVQITGTQTTREGRQFGSGTYANLDFTDDISCVTFKKTLSSWDSGESNKKTINFLVPQYLAKDEDDNNIKSTKLLFRFMDSTGGFPGNIISSDTITFYIKVYKNGTYIETLNITKITPDDICIRPDTAYDMSTDWEGQPNANYWSNVDEETPNEDTDYNRTNWGTKHPAKSKFTGSFEKKLWHIKSVKVYNRGKKEENYSGHKFKPYIIVVTTESAPADYTELTLDYQTISYEWMLNPYNNSDWGWDAIDNLKFGGYYDNYDASSQWPMRETQCYCVITGKPDYYYEYTISNDDLYTFEFYHNEASSLSNINIIGSLIDFEEI